MNFFVLLLGVLLAFLIGRRQVKIAQKQSSISHTQAKTMNYQLMISTIQHDLSMVNERMQLLLNKIQGGDGYTMDDLMQIKHQKEQTELRELELERRNLTEAKRKVVEEWNQFTKSQKFDGK